MDGIKYYDHNWNEIDPPDESKPCANDDFELGWAMGLHFGANNPEQAKKYIATSEYWSKRDVKPVVHGHWITRVAEVWRKDGSKADIKVYADYCSECGSCGTKELDNYCHNCGAKMGDDE